MDDATIGTASQTITQGTLSRFIDLFSGRQDVYGHEKECVKEPLTASVYLAHLKGERRVGVYPLVNQGYTCWIAIDIDDGDFEKARLFAVRCQHYGLLAHIERSKSKGYHVWIFFEQLYLAAKARAAIAMILKECGFSCEVFPKQDCTTPTTSYGNFINLPFFGKDMPTRTVFVDLEDKPVITGVEQVDQLRVTPTSVMDHLVELNGLTCDSSSLPRGANEPGWIAEALEALFQGNRNDTFARITGRLHRDGWEAADILMLLAPHAERSGFPLAELRREVEGIYRRYPAGKSSPSSPHNSGATETESKPLQALPLAVFLESGGQTVEWCVERILPKEGAGILAGPAGYGKSWMLLDLAIECARGGKWLGQFPTSPLRVLYMDEESSPGLLRKRLHKLLGGKKLQREGLDLHFCVGQGLCLTDPASAEQLWRLLEALRPGLVVIDSLIRVHRAEENSASEMAQVFNVVKNLIREFGCAFLFADHQRKPGHFGTSLDLLLRGSSEKAAFVDSLLSLQRKEEALIVEHSKSRYDESVPAFVVKIEDREQGTTTVAYAGEAEALKQQARLEAAREFLAAALRGGDWIARKELIEQAKEAEVSEKAADETLKTLEVEGQVERQDRKPEGGRGGKAAFYRWKPNLSPSQELETETETETEGKSQHGNGETT
ncbi:MAG: AAA family ATPase [Elusimicrobia bacterium]|nr:AAA family ATPase [Elusimicrobiota bacterium]